MKIYPDRTTAPETGKTKKAGKAAEEPAADISRPETGDKVRISPRARRSYRAITEFVLATISGKARWKFPARAITRNLSGQGLCIYTMMPLRGMTEAHDTKWRYPGRSGSRLGALDEEDKRQNIYGRHTIPIPRQMEQPAGPAMGIIK